ncbi:hypothetical protein [Mesorhizobium sp.]|uniref:hypothetical protein n=1 Tax=Mesorhizobium sp. TaxID=1871066 RepID=UPI0025B9977A|nr:hypothetical protein [Mesorhizobium sp.]
MPTRGDIDKSDTFDDFIYDHKVDAYICPAGKELRQRQKTYRMPRPLVDEDGMMGQDKSSSKSCAKIERNVNFHLARA